MRQYSAAKAKHPDALLFFRLGDFYELFFEDAKTASRELQITLTARDKERAIPMCGVPYHAAEQYITRLLRAGYRIALCEQLEDPKTAKTIVRREVTRVLTPGTTVDPALASERTNYLAALSVVGGTVGLALLDNSTGDFRTTEFSGPQAASHCRDELYRAAPAEILLPHELPGLPGQEELERCFAASTVSTLDAWVWTPDYSIPLLKNHFGTRDLAGFGLEEHAAAAIAAGGIIHYLKQTQPGQLEHIDRIRFAATSEYLQLDAATVRNLELVDSLNLDAKREITLFRTLDCCVTPAGKRALRAAILRPMLAIDTISQRLDAVAHLYADLPAREHLRESCGGILDLERLLSRIALDSAGPRDMLALAASLARLPGLQHALDAVAAAATQRLARDLDRLENVERAIRCTIAENPPVQLEDGGAIAGGADAELDELRAIGSQGRASIAAIEQRERQRTGISSLKVRFNSVFGYFIEITRANLSSVPADYERKQTLANAERFSTPELKDYESKILGAQERCLEIERRIFAALRATVLAASARIRSAAQVVAEADLLGCFSHLAASRNYVRPTIDDSGTMEALAARHPVIEWNMQQNGEQRFVPNNLLVDTNGPALLLLTGPNMGGKSTYLRQAALLVIMAQMGCFVPAQRMRLGLVDRIYTRIGASDNVAEGRSTFMMEMTETAAILNTATPRSLLLLDEMGRGTATYDGMSLAWATLEYLHNVIGARAIFATHFHELTLLAERLPRLKNLRVSVHESRNGIVFLHTVEEGAADKSYGIEVARLAGLPREVLNRARQILRQHEQAEKREVEAEAGAVEPSLQMTLFTPLSQRIVDQIQALDVNALTPLQALNLLQQLQQELREGMIDREAAHA